MPNWQVSVSSCSSYLTTGLLGRDCQSPVGVKSGPGAHLELGPFTLQQRTSGDYVGASGSCQVPNAGNLSVQISIRVIRTRISLL